MYALDTRHTDESKTHLFLTPFFEYILGLKVLFNAELWSFHPNFLFCINLKKISRIQHKNEHKSTWCNKKANVATSFKQVAMSQHYVEKVLKLWLCRDIN